MVVHLCDTDYGWQCTYCRYVGQQGGDAGDH